MLAKNDFILDYFMYYDKEEYSLGNKVQDVQEDQEDLVGKSSNSKSIRICYLDIFLKLDFLQLSCHHF